MTVSFYIQLIDLSKEKESLSNNVWAHLGDLSLNKMQETSSYDVTKMDLEMFANELIQCAEGRSIYEVIDNPCKVYGFIYSVHT